MSYDLVPEGGEVGPEPETTEYRLTHFRVYDENGFAGAFGTEAPENATLEGVLRYLCGRFAGVGAEGFGAKDLVVLLGARIVAVILKGPDGRPEVTTFADGVPDGSRPG